MKAKQALASNGLIRDKIQQKFGENCIPGLLRPCSVLVLRVMDGEKKYLLKTVPKSFVTSKRTRSKRELLEWAEKRPRPCLVSILRVINGERKIYSIYPKLCPRVLRPQNEQD